MCSSERHLHREDRNPRTDRQLIFDERRIINGAKIVFSKKKSRMIGKSLANE